MSVRRLRFNRCHCWESEKNRRGQTPENSDGARDAKAGQGRVSRKSKRTETADCGQTREENWLQHASDIMLDVTCFLPDQHHVYPVVHADSQNQTER